MRISGGIARSIPILTPKRGELRPTLDYIREAIFSSLGEEIVNADVLDCFSGSGAYGMESLSRGAKSILCIDKNSSATDIQKINYSAVKKSIESAKQIVGTGKFITKDLFKDLNYLSNDKYDIIFCDPPWPLWEGEASAKLVEQLANLIKTDSHAGKLILEAPADFSPPIPKGWEILKKVGKPGKNQPLVSILHRISLINSI